MVNHFHCAPPVTKKVNSTKIFHETFKNKDPYAWLKAQNWQDVLKNPQNLQAEIRNHLEEENQYFDRFLEKDTDQTKALFKEMRGRIKEDDSSVPEKNEAFYYGYMFNENAQHPNFYRSKTFDGPKEIYLSGDQEAKNKSYFQLGSVIASPDHETFMFAYDDKGAEFYQWRIRFFKDQQELQDNVTNAGPYAVWDAHSKGFFYIKLDDHHRPSQVFYHKLGTEQKEDILIYVEKSVGYFLSLQGSKSHDYIFINIHDHETSEILLLDAKHDYTAEALPPYCVKPREKGIEYSLIAAGDIFYILTNKDGAKDFKIMQTPINKPQEENWKDIVDYQKGRIILDVDAYENYLTWLERENGLPRIIIKERQSGQEHSIAFQEEAYSLGFIGARDYKSSTIRFTYSSLTTPQKLFSYAIPTQTKTLLKTQQIPSGHNEQDYITKRLYATALDGEKIPISLYYHKDTKLDGSAPCLLYGYGAYGISIAAQFSSPTLSLVNRGFIYAIAHIRGGKEKGTFWYENGKYKHKKNSFTDFIASGRYLVEQQYTKHDRLIAYGGSAGGMLMGAIANMAPKDFFAIIALVPFVDVLNTMLDDTLPLTPPEWPEWGNPLASKEDYALIASYSPYDQVKKQDYPHILAMAGLTDPRVTYWEAAKWIAKLRDHKTNQTPIFLKTNMDSGHGGASGRFSKLEETALIYSYILKLQNKL